MNPFLISPNNSMPSLEVKKLEMAIGGYSDTNDRIMRKRMSWKVHMDCPNDI